MGTTADDIVDIIVCRNMKRERERTETNVPCFGEFFQAATTAPTKAPNIVPVPCFWIQCVCEYVLQSEKSDTFFNKILQKKISHIRVL